MICVQRMANVPIACRAVQWGAPRDPMTTQADVRRMALSLPGAEQVRGRFAFSVRTKGKLKAFVWVWMERVTPKKPRVPNFDVIAVRVANLGVQLF